MKSMEEKFRNSAKFFQGAQTAVRFLGRRLRIWKNRRYWI